LVINKVIFEKGAIFDYEGIVCHIPLEESKMRREVEKLIDKQEYSLYEEDLRVTYYDDSSESELLLFVRKGYCFGPMQSYIVQGICLKDDYDEEMETSGIISDWLGVEIE
jgi:hypothetical protein